MTHFHDDKTMKPPHMNNSLLDGMVTMAGLAIATGGFFYTEIMMWWAGA